MTLIRTLLCNLFVSSLGPQWLVTTKDGTEAFLHIFLHRFLTIFHMLKYYRFREQLEEM